MTDGDVLLQEVLTRPNDLDARKVYADWLIRHGDPVRGEFIHTQILLDSRRRHVVEGTAAVLARGQRCWELIEAHNDGGHRMDLHDFRIGDRVDLRKPYRMRRGRNTAPKYGLRVSHDAEGSTGISDVILVQDDQSVRDLEFEDARNRLAELTGLREDNLRRWIDNDFRTGSRQSCELTRVGPTRFRCTISIPPTLGLLNDTAQFELQYRFGFVDLVVTNWATWRVLYPLFTQQTYDQPSEPDFIQVYPPLFYSTFPIRRVFLTRAPDVDFFDSDMQFLYFPGFSSLGGGVTDVDDLPAVPMDLPVRTELDNDPAMTFHTQHMLKRLWPDITFGWPQLPFPSDPGV